MRAPDLPVILPEFFTVVLFSQELDTDIPYVFPLITFELTMLMVPFPILAMLIPSLSDPVLVSVFIIVIFVLFVISIALLLPIVIPFLSPLIVP